MKNGNRIASMLAALLGLAVVNNVTSASVIPQGPATITFGYETADGPVSFTDTRQFNGTGPTDATVFSNAPNLKSFASVNTYGYRPQIQGAVYPGESVIANAFYKININQDFFPGIVEDSNVTISVSGIHFDQPVTLDESTFLFHTFWDADQVDMLEHPYNHVHNFHTATDPYRDADLFAAAGFFTTFPHMSYALADVDPVITGQGTDTLGYTLSVPYHLLRHLDEEHNHDGNMVPPGLPAPHGFLEPYHLHVEFVVAPEPTSLALLAVGGLAILRARRR